MSNALFMQLLCCQPCPVIPSGCSPLFVACAGTGGTISFAGSIVVTIVQKNPFYPTLIEYVDEVFISFSAGGTIGTTSIINIAAGSINIRKERVSWRTEYDDFGNPFNFECQRIVDVWDPLGEGQLQCTAGNSLTVENWQALTFRMGVSGGVDNCTRTVTFLSNNPSSACFGQQFSYRFPSGIFFAEFGPARGPNTTSAPSGCELNSNIDPGVYRFIADGVLDFGPQFILPWGPYNYDDGITSTSVDGYMNLRLS